ncbi:hypothetical protein [Changchengzhania lutea]|uniref:hypothetical protein n=1 Tax=Changchengzhania lutea TaxID=2049305 RepID=UPI001C8F590E|nr:hypothetical protein [Changchengzhania lutea]
MEKKMLEKNFDVQSIGINANHRDVFEFVAKPENLPLWTKAFTKADTKSAIMVTPNGELSIEMETVISKDMGTVDWVMKMPDGSIGKAFSRVSENGNAAIYSFILLAPPVPLEQLEGALSAQKLLLADELVNLKNLLETK